VDRNQGFVSFVSPPTRLESEEAGKRVASAAQASVGHKGRSAEKLRSATENNRQNRQNLSRTAEEDSGTVPGNFYDDALTALRSECIELVELARWLQAITDAQAFLAVWGAQADALGWGADELFGLHPIPEQSAPNFRRLSRYDGMGLFWLLHGRPVIALTTSEAVIRTASSATLTYRKRQPGGKRPPGGFAKGTAT
jgi:hypothetical protein